MLKSIFDYTYNKIRLIEERLHNGATLLVKINRSIQVDSFSCAVQAVYSILNYYNINRSHDEIASKLGTTEEDGTDTEPILNYLRSLKLKVIINEKATIDTIKESINKLSPVLITIDDWEHWVLIYGYSENRLFLLDSNKKRILNSIPHTEFLQRWDDNWIATIYKA